jgi:hypothetical protein
VRGRLSPELETILRGYGFIRDEEATFMMSLRSSSSHRRKRTSTYLKKREPLSPLPSLTLIASPKERLSLVVGLSRLLEVNSATEPLELANFYRSQVADYYLRKAVLLSDSARNPNKSYHSHSLFLPSGALSSSSDHPLFALLSVFEIESIEMDFEANEDQLPVDLLPCLSPFIANGGKVVSLKSASALAKTVRLESELATQFRVEVTPIAQASPYYSGLMQSEPTLKE